MKNKFLILAIIISLLFISYNHFYKETSNIKIDNKYKIIEVDGGNLSGYREPNVAVNIGYGNREYWAFTNEHGQLVRVIAKEIILQNDTTEPVNNNGRYYNDEAKVPGVESPNLDEGHVIADSLGGVSNAYNITPQNSTLNRYGGQAHMEKIIRDFGGCTDFEAIITYPNEQTQIPNKYKYTYKIKGNIIIDEFENVNPDKINQRNKIGGFEMNKVNIITNNLYLLKSSISKKKFFFTADNDNEAIEFVYKNHKDAGLTLNKINKDGTHPKISLYNSDVWEKLNRIN